MPVVDNCVRSMLTHPARSTTYNGIFHFVHFFFSIGFFFLCIQSCHGEASDSECLDLVSIGCRCSSTVVSCIGLGLTHLPSASVFPRNIKELIFTRNKISSINLENEKFANLKVLNLASNDLTSRSGVGKAIRILTKLEKLFLQRNKISVVNITYLSGTKLKLLNISSNPLSYFFYDQHADVELEELYMRNIQLKKIPADAFSSFTHLKILDLGDNNLKTLPKGIFDNLQSIQRIDLSGNPWQCDCQLKWLRQWLIVAMIKMVDVVNREKVSCARWPSLPLTTIDVDHFMSSCYKIKKRSTDTWDWLQKCLRTATFVPDCEGLSEIASCVYSIKHRSTVLIRYTVTDTARSPPACQLSCFNQEKTYFLHVPSIDGCICGTADVTCVCDSCQDVYDLKPGANSVLSGFSVRVTSPAVVGAPVNVQMFPPIELVRFEWNFGDGSEICVTNTSSVSHTYVYTGTFTVDITVCSDQICQATHLPLKVVSLTDGGKLHCENKYVKLNDNADVRAQFSLASGVEVIWHTTSEKTGQTETVQCNNGDELDRDSGHCFHLLKPSSWFDAQMSCHNSQDGNLAVITSDSVNNFIVTKFLNADVWIGLYAPAIPGHYVWTSGDAVGAYNKLKSPTEACVALGAAGTWSTKACDQLLQAVCEYTPNKIVLVPLHIAGSMELKDAGQPFNQIPSVQSGSTSGFTLMLFPGLWFAQNGKVRFWNFHTDPTGRSTLTILVVYRPTCPAGSSLYLSGCGDNHYSGCSTETLTCDLPISCQGDQHLCPLSASCVSSALACSCAGEHGRTSCDANPYPSGSSLPSYTPVGSTSVYVTAAQIYTIPADISVQAGDVIGVLSEGSSDVLSCELSPTSQWTQNKYIFRNVASDKTVVSNKKHYNISPGLVCHINAVYSHLQDISLPPALSVFPEPGVYTVGYQTAGSSASKQCQVTVQEELVDIVWVFPTLDSDGSITVEIRTSVTLVAKVKQGSDVQYVWQVDGVNITKCSIESACPSELDGAVVECNASDSSITKPFTFITQTFQKPGEVKLMLYNDVSFKTIVVQVKIDRCMTIEGLRLFHTSCTLPHTECSPLVEVGVDQLFEVEITTGMVDVYSYNLNGALLVKGGKYLNHTFSTAGQFDLVVNGSCGSHWMIASLVITAKIAALVEDFHFTSEALTVVAVNETLTLEYYATVQKGAEINITVGFYTGVPTTKTQTTSSTNLRESDDHTYTQDGRYLANITIRDSFREVSIEKIIYVLHKLKAVRVESLVSVVLVNREIQFKAIVSSMSGPVALGLANLTYNWTFPDSLKQSRTLDMTSIESHKMSVLGEHHITVEVDNYISSVLGMKVITVEQCIVGLRLTYNGPQLVSDNITLSCSYQEGTNVTFIFDVGDGRAPVNQTGSQLTVQYSSVGVYNVTVTATNDLYTVDCHPASSLLTVYIMDNNTLIVVGILETPCIAINNTVALSAHIINIDPASLTYEWQFGNGKDISGVDKQNVTTSYGAKGMYKVSVVVNGNKSAKTIVCVQESITGLEISKPKPAVVRMAIRLSVSTVSGSDILYGWKIDNVWIKCVTSLCSITRDQPGSYIVRVVAYNNISQEVIDVRVVFQKLIMSLKLFCSTCDELVYANTAEVMYLNVSVAEGTNVSYVWDYGDGSEGKGSEVSHGYTTEGQFTACVTASNLIDTDQICIEITAEDPITDLTLTSDKRNIVTGSSVQLEASQRSGSGIRYVWHCVGQSEVSTADRLHTVQFDVSQEHVCSVTAANHVTKQLVASVSIFVFENIHNLEIIHELIDNKYGPALEVLKFEAKSNTVFMVSYMWQVNKYGFPKCVESGKSLSQLCSSFHVGVYTINLRATNMISTKSVTLDVVIIERIQNPRLDTSDRFVSLNSQVRLAVLMDTGSDVVYSWSVSPPQSAACADENNVRLCHFSAVGSYMVSVNVHNVLDTVGENMQTDLQVQQQVRDVSIQSSIGSDFEFVTLRDILTFTPIVLQGSDLHYSWLLSFEGQPLTRSRQAVFSHTFTEIGSYHLLLDVSNDISSDQRDGVIKVEQKIMTVELSTNKNIIPTGDSIILLATVTQKVTSMFEWSINGVSQPVTVSSFQKAFLSADNYTIVVTAYNHVSRVSDTLNITVEDRISGLELSNCSVYRPALTNTNLVASVTAGTDVEYTWAVETVSGTKKAYRGMKVQHTFDSPGSFLVELFASNLVSNTSTRCTVNVQGIVKIFTVQITSDINYLFVKQLIHFVTIGVNLSDTIFKWKFDDSVEVSTKNGKYERMFTVARMYELTVTASNKVSHDMFTIQFTIYELDCEIPIVSVIGESSRTVFRSHSLELEMTIDSKGCIAYNSKHMWEVYRTADCSSDMTDKVSLGNTHVTSPALKVKPRVFSYDTYCVKFTTMYEDTVVKESAFYVLTVVASPLKAMIAGGTECKLPEGEQLVLDGSHSFDPDTLESTGSGLTYEWTCKTLSVNTVESDCPRLGRSDKIIVVFPQGTYCITLTVTKGTRRDSFQQNIQVVKGRVPEVRVECVSCKSSNTFQVSPNQQVALSSTCSNCHSNTQYKWQVERDGNKVPLDMTTTTTGDTNMNLVIRPNVLGFARTYTFSLTVTSQTFSNEGNAKLELPCNSPPSGGTCIIGGSSSPIVPLESQLEVTCLGWSDDTAGPLYYQILVDGEVYSRHTLYHGTHATQSVYVTPLTAESDRVKIQVKVVDELGAAGNAGEKMVLFARPSIDTSMTDYLVKMAGTELQRLVKQNKPVSLLQYAIALSQELNEQSDSKGREVEESREKRAMVRDAITLSLIMIPVNSLQDVQQMAYLLRLLTKCSKEYQTAASHLLIVKVLEDMVQVLQSYALQGLDREEFVSHRLMSTISNLIEAVNLSVYSPEDVPPSPSTSLSSLASKFTNLRSEINSFISGLPVTDPLESVQNEVHRKQVVPRAFKIAEDIMSVSLMTTVLTEESLVFNLADIEVHGQRTKTEDVWKKKELLGCMFSLSPTLFDSVTSASEEIFQIMFVHSKNPYTWGSFKGFTVTSNVPALSFKHADGSDIILRELPDKDKIKILMFLDNKANYTVSTDSVIDSAYYKPLDSLMYSHFTMDSKTSKKIVVDSSGGQSRVSALHIQIRMKVLQNITEKEQGVQPSGSVSTYLGVNYEATKSRYEALKTIETKQMADGADHRDYTIFIPSQTFSRESSYSVSVFNDDQLHQVTLSVSVYFSSCQFYDTSINKWSARGCEVAEESIAICSVCLCDHLTSFGGSVLVPPSAIDFTDLTRLDLSLNPVVMVAICIILLIYVVIVIFSWYWDRMDLHRISLIPLCGKTGSHKYEVTVITGRLLGAGTTAHIGIKLYGQQGKSEPRHLSKTDISAFQRNCCDKFLIATDVNLGDLWKILIWHDNTGLSPSWYLHRVEVIDIRTDVKYYFLADVWLSVQQEKGILQKEISVAGTEELKKFSTTLKTATYEGFAEKHIWTSVFNRPDSSRFTRVQRATCCVTILFVFMFINAMWYGLLKDRTDIYNDISWSSFSWEELIIGLVSNAIVFPVALIIVFLFKKSRSQKNVFKSLHKPQTAQTIEIPCDISQYSSSLRSCSPHGDWESCYDRESTADSVRASDTRMLHRTSTVMNVNQDVHRQDHSNNLNTTKKSSLQSIRRTHELMWSHDNILKNWPEKVPSWSENGSSTAAHSATAHSTTAHSTTAHSTTAHSTTAHSTTAHSTTAHSTTAHSTTAHSTTTDSSKKESALRSDCKMKPKKKDNLQDYGDSDEEFQQTLDELDKELNQTKTSKQTKARKAAVRSETSTNKADKDDVDLFSSDDEWSKNNVIPTKEKRSAKKSITKTPSAPAGATASRFQPREPPDITPRSDDTGNVDDILYSDDDEISTDKKAKKEFKIALSRRYNPRVHGQRERKISSSSVKKTSSHGTSNVKETSFVKSDVFTGSHRGSDDIRDRNMSAYWMRHSSISQSARQNATCTLPPWCVYVAYVLCALLTAVSIVMILLYGYKFGAQISLKWLLSLVISFLCSAFIIEPVKVLVLAVYVAVFSEDVHEERDCDAIDILPSVLENEQIKDVKFRPLGGFALLQAREEGMNVERMHVMLRQFVIYSFLLGLLLAVCFVHFPHSAFISTQYLEHRLNSNTPAHLKLTTLRSIADVQVWMPTVLAETMHRRDLHTEEFSTLLGVARLRQVRSVTEKCPATSHLNKLQIPTLTSNPCDGSLTFMEDTAHYGLQWNKSSNINHSWPYSSADSLNMLSRFGHVQLYSGGGYVVTLGSTYNETVTILQDLFRQDWMNLQTRAIFMEFTLYSMAENLASTVSILLEFPLSGGVLSSLNVLTQRLMWYDPPRIDPFMVCEALFMACVVYLLVHLILTIKHQKVKFVTIFWNWLDVAIMALALTCAGVYIVCITVTTNTFHEFFADKQGFINFARPAHLHEVLRYSHAWLLFLFFIKVVRQLRFIKCLHVHHKTIGNAVGKLLGCTFIFVILLFTYAQLGYLFYGAAVKEFATFPASLMTLMAIMRGSVDLTASLTLHPVFSQFYFYSFYTFTYGVFIALVIAVLNDTYRLTRQQLFYKASLEPQDYEMIEFIMKRFKLWAGIKKPKPAFRRVKFEGQPSLPSRRSSSARSSHSISTSSSEQLGQESAALFRKYMIDKMQPQWENVLSRFHSIVKLDKEEDQQLKKLEKEVKDWKMRNQSQEKRSLSQGKLSASHKTKHTKLQASPSPANQAGRKLVTQPNVSLRKTNSEKGWRPFSDQCERLKSDQSGEEEKNGRTVTPSKSKNVHFSKQVC